LIRGRSKATGAAVAAAVLIECSREEEITTKRIEMPVSRDGVDDVIEERRRRQQQKQKYLKKKREWTRRRIPGRRFRGAIYLKM
jgi:hypothetical protein